MPDQEPAFDVLSTTAVELRQRLDNSTLTSVQIVQTYLDQIHCHNSAGAHLNLIISLRDSTQLLEDAKTRDEERNAGKARGPLHGIPFITKDAYATAPEHGMPTTAGSFALKESRTRGDAAVIDALLASGMILMGKSNLSEFCGLKGVPGWSAVGGQAQSPYVPGGLKEGEPGRGPTAPGGSSTGSAHGVAAGFAPLALGTETCGSLISPSSRAGVYTLKLTPGSTNMDGICRISLAWDTIGGFSKTVEELAILSELLLQTGTQRDAGDSLTNHLRKDFSGLRVGFVEPEKWGPDDDTIKADPNYPDEIKSQIEWAMTSIEARGGEVVYPVELPAFETLHYEGELLLFSIQNAEAKPSLEQYLDSLESSPVQTLDQIIRYNDENPSLELPASNPGQENLLAAANSSIDKEDLSLLHDIFYARAGKDGVEKTIHLHNLDVIVAPVDSTVQTISTGSLTPSGSVPLGYASINGHPFGAQMLALSGNEGKLIEAMSAWEEMFPKRKTPDLSWTSCKSNFGLKTQPPSL